MNTKAGFWITRIFLVIIATTLLIGCQRDDESSPPLQVDQTNSSIETSMQIVSADDIPEVMNYLSTQVDSRGQFTITKQNNNTRSSESDLVISELQTREIIQVTDQYERSNYTFLLTSIESFDPNAKSIFI